MIIYLVIGKTCVGGDGFLIERRWVPFSDTFQAASDGEAANFMKERYQHVVDRRLFREV